LKYYEKTEENVKSILVQSDINTGTVSRYTLTDILKEKSEHICLCPMCNEDDLTIKLN
jgi:hypothetical protein